jgi:cbb3-type cytochrome oxidase maturation protein
MDVIYALIPSMIFIGLVLVALLFWSIKSGQFDDFEGDAQRILMDEDLIPTKKSEDEDENKNKKEKE